MFVSSAAAAAAAAVAGLALSSALGAAAQAPAPGPAPAPAPAAPATPAAPAAPAAAGCFSLAGSTACQPWAAYSIQPQAPLYTDLATFQTYIQSMADNSTTYTQTFRTVNQCPGYNGGGLRYHVSFLCGMIVDADTANGFCNTNPAATPPPKLCLSSGRAAMDSLSAVLADRTVCPVARSMPLAMTTYQASLVSDTNCVPGILEEWTMCGFWANAATTAYCAAPGRADQCCAAYTARLAGTPVVLPTSLTPVAPAPVASGGAGAPGASLGPAAGTGSTTPSTPSPASASGAAQPSANPAPGGATAGAQAAQAFASSSYGTPTTPIIIGAAAVALIAILAVIFAVVYARRRRSGRAPDGFMNASSSSSREGSLKYKQNMSGAPRAAITPTYSGNDRYSASNADDSLNRFGNSGETAYGNPNSDRVPLAMASQAAPQSSAAQPMLDPSAAAAMLGVEAAKEDVGEPIQIAETMEVMYNYVPNLVDEIYLYIGDPVIVKCKFDDGWGFGFNMTTKQEGSFPLACVAPYNSNREVAAPAGEDDGAEEKQQQAAAPPLSLTPLPALTDENGWNDTLDSRRRISSLGRVTPLQTTLQPRIGAGAGGLAEETALDSPHNTATTLQSSPLSTEYTYDGGESSHVPAAAEHHQAPAADRNAPSGAPHEFDGDDANRPHLQTARQTFAQEPQIGSYESYESNLYSPRR
ncbi:hypothetical protein HDU87_005915 [Geranomyces variabilis]|uniref:SH3 domain-containing protein n=1 Tax=Geranomyces variabilis TaxID=109894 RepID=A0AAD5TQR5_9FUNG|nr:hypothetical protein HDU87_005915 [Geranomyces variabilis]